uniref:Peptidoglycan recognition protein family domain-containing protein n=1 Tax=Mola mola TaxID=94237 RepID=A0A3Q4B2D7_MOLML
MQHDFILELSILLLVCLTSSLFTAGVHLCNMESFIQAVQQVENSNPGLSPLVLVLGVVQTAIINNLSFTFFDKAIHHIVTDFGEERGVVLASDGTTVALAPLLLGIESGLKAKIDGTPAVGIFPLTLGRTLGLSFLSLQDFPSSYCLGPNGCWDNVDHPMFKLSRPATLATDAVINGGMDGVIMGMDLSTLPAHEQPQALSEILKRYYRFIMQEGQDLDAVSSHFSPRQKEVSKYVLEPLDPHNEVMETLALVWKLENTEWIALARGVAKAVKDGSHAFAGTPIPLSLPLQFLHVHHTYEPSSPCLSFQNCSHNMRSMQRFHQEDRFWSDIGYSFVIGSDGYIYEGRGWNHLGTHTRGHNHIGYGVSIIGNYTCAVDRGGLTVVNYTSCPGDILSHVLAQDLTWVKFRHKNNMVGFEKDE